MVGHQGLQQDSGWGPGGSSLSRSRSPLNPLWSWTITSCPWCLHLWGLVWLPQGHDSLISPCGLGSGFWSREPRSSIQTPAQPVSPSFATPQAPRAPWEDLHPSGSLCSGGCRVGHPSCRTSISHLLCCQTSYGYTCKCLYSRFWRCREGCSIIMFN